MHDPRSEMKFQVSVAMAMTTQLANRLHPRFEVNRMYSVPVTASQNSGCNWESKNISFGGASSRRLGTAAEVSERVKLLVTLRYNYPMPNRTGCVQLLGTKVIVGTYPGSSP